MKSASLRNLLVATVFTLITGGLLIGMIYFVHTDGLRLEEQIAALAQEKAQEDSYFRLQRLVADTATERSELQGYFLGQQSDSIDLLNTIEALGREAGVVLDTPVINLLVDKTDSKGWIKLDLAFVGPRERVETFIKLLENISYVSRITDLTWSTQSQNQLRATVSMQVRVLEYE